MWVFVYFVGCLILYISLFYTPVIFLHNFRVSAKKFPEKTVKFGLIIRQIETAFISIALP